MIFDCNEFWIVFQVVSSAIVDKYIGESARLIREMFGMSLFVIDLYLFFTLLFRFS